MEELNMNLIDRDIHHISWKNHGVDNYIKKALANYLKKQRSDSNDQQEKETI